MVGKGSPKNVMAKGCRFLSSAPKKKPSPKFSGSRSAGSPKGMFVHAFLSFFLIDAMEILLLVVIASAPKEWFLLCFLCSGQHC
jgi:hypothetical protein